MFAKFHLQVYDVVGRSHVVKVLLDSEFSVRFIYEWVVVKLICRTCNVSLDTESIVDVQSVQANVKVRGFSYIDLKVFLVV